MDSGSSPAMVDRSMRASLRKGATHAQRALEVSAARMQVSTSPPDKRSMVPLSGPSSLARTLTAAYMLLIVYACLHPLAGWQSSGLPAFDFLFEPWPKYVRTEDLVVNVLGFVPLGFVAVPALGARFGTLGRLFLAALVGTVLSLSVETAQNFLPNRIASNVDLGSNALGSLLGAMLGTFWGKASFDQGGWLQQWRAQRIIPGRTGDVGLVLVGLWLLTQALPETILFASGDLRDLFGVPTPLPFAPERFIRIEAAMVASGLLAAGLLVRCMLKASGLGSIALLIVLGLAIKSLATAAFLVPGSPGVWLTPGTRHGLLGGTFLLLLALGLPRIHQHALAGMGLLVATALANLIPENPYLLADQRLLGRGNFLNFHGLTQLIATLWPFLALAYLSALGLWRGEHLREL